MDEQGMSDTTFLIVANSVLLSAMFTSIIVNIREIRRINKLIYGKNKKIRWGNRG
jgi:hypothetical protein